MTFTEIRNLVTEILAKYDIARPPIVINNRMSHTLGTAEFKYHPMSHIMTPVRIQLSGRLLETATDEDIQQTILHECAHIIANVKNGCDCKHGLKFKMACAEIGCKNDKPSQIVSYTTNVPFKYTIVCPKCGILGGYQTKCKTVQNINHYRCSNCKSPISIKEK